MIEYAIASWIEGLSIGYKTGDNLCVDETPLSPQTPDNIMTVVGVPDGWDKAGNVYSATVYVSVRYGTPVQGARAVAILARLIPDLVETSPHLTDTVSGLDVVYHLNSVGLTGGGQLAGIDELGRYTVRLPLRLSYQVVDWGRVPPPGLRFPVSLK
jgi:hypothetical protein